MIDLGQRVRDVVTGFTGIAVARIESLFGVGEIHIAPERLTEDGSPGTPVWFEETRVEAVSGDSVVERSFKADDGRRGAI